MLKAKTPGASKAQRGERIDPGLKAALNTRVSQAGKPHQLALSELVPNPNNKRELVIPLQELMSALKVGTEESLVYLDDGLLVFPEREELADLGAELDIRTRKEEKFYDKIRELAQSIQQHQLIYPIECSPLVDQKGYLIETGHRRWFAAHFVPGKEKLESVIKEKGEHTDLEKALRRRDENAKRHDLSLLEQIDEVADIIDLAKREAQGKVSQVKLAAVLGMPKYEMSYFVKIIKSGLEEVERAILRDNDLSDLRTVADICRLDDRELRLKAFELYQDKGNTHARNYVQQRLEAAKGPVNEQAGVTATVVKPKKVSTTPVAAELFVSTLRSKLPELLDGIDHDDPITVLQSVLKRFEEEAAS
ncbi:ParB/RepB/Spo0J family partition protein [Neptuniibacter halophilus]|uniref:ParB/RepB/Spo0J family partition protein n=1 Tax=Neptuniibacter halophilus TaxID=651666 RepID=UPI002573A8DD|nr:ParB N-terminal domain-containing protein [Neptuniibacter halophilus]